MRFALLKNWACCTVKVCVSISAFFYKTGSGFYIIPCNQKEMETQSRNERLHDTNIWEPLQITLYTNCVFRDTTEQGSTRKPW